MVGRAVLSRPGQRAPARTIRRLSLRASSSRRRRISTCRRPACRCAACVASVWQGRRRALSSTIQQRRCPGATSVDVLQPDGRSSLHGRRPRAACDVQSMSAQSSRVGTVSSRRSAARESVALRRPVRPGVFGALLSFGDVHGPCRPMTCHAPFRGFRFLVRTGSSSSRPATGSLAGQGNVSLTCVNLSLAIPPQLGPPAHGLTRIRRAGTIRRRRCRSGDRDRSTPSRRAGFRR